MSTHVAVYLDHTTPVRVGTLWFGEARGRVKSAFVYTDEWLRRRFGFALSPDLPLDSYPKTCEGLFHCLRDASPESWGQTLLRRSELAQAEAENRGPHALLASDLLLQADDFTRQGALRFSTDDGRTFLAPFAEPRSAPPIEALPRLLEAVRRVEDAEAAERDLDLLVAPCSALGGSRPKVSIRGEDGRLFLAKLPSPGDVLRNRDIPLWEYVTLRLARRAGLRTPRFHLRRVEGASVLLVERFDREGLRRVPFLSAKSLLRPGDGEFASYLDIAAAIGAEGACPAEDLPELWARVVFNMCVYNVDDHLRNHGFLRTPRGWRLSPVYDLETSHPGEADPFLHTGIAEWASLFNLKEALDVAEYFRLRESTARERLAEVRGAVSHWREEAEQAGAAASEIRLMRDAFEFL